MLFHWLLRKLNSSSSQWCMWACEEGMWNGKLPLPLKQRLFLSFCCYYISLPVRHICGAQSLRCPCSWVVFQNRNWRSSMFIFFSCGLFLHSVLTHSFTVFWYLLKLLRLVYESAIFVWFYLFFFKADFKIQMWIHQMPDNGQSYQDQADFSLLLNRACKLSCCHGWE